ncbi:glucosidase [Mucilaginibacter sp. ZT4R22]|uniref:Glucosidase n=2 Tax=Mucilaginibacter pankratovii TaxID=2772110 RepID=A0ABR7WSY7_9SPHI|nr:glucosidase [Mucilaginibacter pankratovii]
MKNAEKKRLLEPAWKNWGPYISDRQWGTVREDYSKNGDAWSFVTHEMARSKAYRWGEDGIAGICDKEQLLCFSVAFWNRHDPILKERFFGLTNQEGNHGEDVKECYYYLDNTPTHSYMKMLYQYPHTSFPYNDLVTENSRRSKADSEYELPDTGVFDHGHFELTIEYAKRDHDDLLIRITITNHGEAAQINVIPTLWFRNTWSWNEGTEKPEIKKSGPNSIAIDHSGLGNWKLICSGAPELLFCENETNTRKLYQYGESGQFYKDGINDFIVSGSTTVNPDLKGTKAAANYLVNLAAGESHQLYLNLSCKGKGLNGLEKVFSNRITEADEFYEGLMAPLNAENGAEIRRQAFASLLWNKQFYALNVNTWLDGDDNTFPPPQERKEGRNHKWRHFDSKEIISMPDKWEFPWFASWDLAFHCLPLAEIDPQFAKNQLLLLLKENFMHPNGQLPAYEWNFEDVNPPVHAFAALAVYQTDKKLNNGQGDEKFLAKIFHKLMLNYSWWLNRKDAEGSNIFEGGFMGLDNVGIFDRGMQFDNGIRLEQIDATSWMAMYSLNMLRIALTLSKHNDVYGDMAANYFEHFLSIAGAMSYLGNRQSGLWDDESKFFYDQLRYPDGSFEPIRIRSIIGFLPLLAVEIVSEEEALSPDFRERLKWLSENRSHLASLVSEWRDQNEHGEHLMSLLRRFRMKSLLAYMLDEKEFLSPYGIRSLSKAYANEPYKVNTGARDMVIQYLPAESDSSMYGGNSNWRGPVWIPLNYMIIESLNRFHRFYGDRFKVECPTGSGTLMNLKEVAEELSRRLAAIFLPGNDGDHPFRGAADRNPNSDSMLYWFNEYFNGDTGMGLGASHQTGWTALITKYL